MKRFLTLALFILVLLALVVPSLGASAGSQQASLTEVIPSQVDDSAVTNEGEALVPGNYCVSCHLADDPRLASVTAWNGSIVREVNSPCPAATKIHEELYYTERMMLMIERAQGTVGSLPEKTAARIEGYSQRYSRLLDQPVTSLDAFVSESQTTRYQLNKGYATLNQMAEAQKKRTVLAYAAAVTLVVLASLAWGLYNTRAVRSGMTRKSWALFWRILFVLAVVASFTLPIFRVPAAPITMTTVEQQEAQTTRDTAQRAADAADRAQARAWMLARVGIAWGKVDPLKESDILQESLVALNTASENDPALWGQSLVVQEVSVGRNIDMEKADLVAAELNAARGRAWALPLVAEELNTVDPARAIALLDGEQENQASQTGIYRDLQMRALALAWVNIDPERAGPTASLISDPSLRAWTLRELAVLENSPQLFDRAADAAGEIADPVQRARALREIGLASGKDDYFVQALVALEDLDGASLAYALSDLAAASGNVSLVDRIDPTYPDARVSALLRLGQYSTAWDASAAITDPVERARAQAAIAGAWSNGEAALQINLPLYRDLALRDIIRKSGNSALLESISSVYYRIQAWTALGNTATALAAADKLADSYPLVELANILAKEDPQSALELINMMSRETDKASALRMIATVMQTPELIDQARGMALASRVTGDSLAPSQASLDLAQALWQVDISGAQDALAQAYEAAQRIAIK